MDNLNTHKLGSLYDAIEPKEARRIAERLVIHYPPQRGSWLDMAEIEIGVLSRRCLNRRIPDQETLRTEIRAWQEQRNHKAICVPWRFPTEDKKDNDDISNHHDSIETLTGLNDHVNYLHTKYMLVDPLSDDPIVISGSANFSKASTVNNDENMVIIRGNTRIADIFLVEFMRLFNHFETRNKSNKLNDAAYAKARLLHSDDSWTKPYYKEGALEQQERLLFG